MKTKFIWIILYYQKTQLQNINKDHANVADATNNQQRLKNIKNMCVTDKTGLAVCKCDFKINNEKKTMSLQKSKAFPLRCFYKEVS